MAQTGRLSFGGTLHGVYLVINHAFQKLTGEGMAAFRASISFKLSAWALTFISAVVAWVFFRANDFPSAVRVLSGMSPFPIDSNLAHGISSIFWNQGLDTTRGTYWLVFLSVIAFLMPNSNRIGESALRRCRRHRALVPHILGAALTVCAFLILVNSARDSASAFIYFNF